MPNLGMYPDDNSVLIMDIASIHKSRELHEVLGAEGVKLESLPPYSPELNPIEQTWSKLKAWIMAECDFVRNEDPFVALSVGLSGILPCDCRAWIAYNDCYV